MAPISPTLGHTLGATQTPPRTAADDNEQPHLYVLLECDRPLALSTRHALGNVGEVLIGRGRERVSERINIAGTRGLSIQIPDRWISSAHARITQSFGRWVLEDQESKNGTVVNGSPASRRTLEDGDLIECGHTLLLYRDAVPILEGSDQDVDLAVTAEQMPGLTTLIAPLAADLQKLSKLATSNVSILILGESGTGKEVIARAIHTLSGRCGEFIGVNCGAIPDSLIESELFGHKKGAFSGAVVDSPGLVRSAHEGTLFLDEIADLQAPSQAAFLRVLQEREVRAVGETRSIPVDIRLVSATHQDLIGKLEGGDFRNDLFARICGYRITLPPLRERLEDLGFLIGVLLRRVASDSIDELAIDIEAARALFGYPWPLNIRELEHALQTSTVLAGHGSILLEHLPEPIRIGTAAAASTAQTDDKAAIDDLTDEQRQHRAELDALFRDHTGNVSAVARATGKDRKQIQRWMKRYGLVPASYR